jgi:hypothetical protein
MLLNCLIRFLVDIQKQVGGFIVVLKGLSHEMDFAFDDMHGQLYA